jgi:hypothetical protein
VCERVFRVKEDSVNIGRTPTMATVRTPTAGNKPVGKTPSPKPGPSSISTVRRSIGSIEEKLAKNATSTISRLQEAKNYLQSGRRNLDASRNMKTELRDGVHQALTGLFSIIKDLDGNSSMTVKGKESVKESAKNEKGKNETEKVIEKMMNKRNEWMKEMKGMIEGQKESGMNGG